MNSQPIHGGLPCGGAGSGGIFDRMREDRLREDRIRESEVERKQREMQREREREESGRQHREPYHANGPHHSDAGSIPIHQPVASRINSSIHSPGGLLSTHGGPGPSINLNGPSGPSAAHPGPVHGDSNRHLHHGGPGGAAGGSGSQQQLYSAISHGPNGPGHALGSSTTHSAIFGGPLQSHDNARNGQQEGARGMQPIPFSSSMGAGHPAPPGAAGMQGQQPILNDALSYLDQVKVQFHDHPDVYNKFLDIMKDFKSQNIDTPGVISRVSELFAGHPNLIQGFNTFLPPGYRIECGLENNPNSIRVTTPSGSTIHSIGGGRATHIEPPQPAPPAAGQSPFVSQRAVPNWPPSLQPNVESPEATFNVPASNAHPTFLGPAGPGQNASFDSPNQQGAVPGPTANGNSVAAGHGPIARTAHTPTLANGPGGSNGSAATLQANLEKRGPVEFNHAISYVNKIKNRFQDRPEIYKQFLEILQTYQREQKPIQDVYSQVTTLFHTAPDLLEDFKQFLPESAASTRSGAPRAEDAISLAVATSTPQPNQSAREAPKMPPVGNFAPPPSASKENKKRPRNDKSSNATTMVGSSSNEQATSSMRTTGAPGPANNKRAKLSHKNAPAGTACVEPTLTPVMPEPIGPIPIAISAVDDLTFFDKVRKHVGNKTVMTEFLKLTNLFTMDLIDPSAFIYKASQFIGNNPYLMNWLRNMICYGDTEQTVQNKPTPPNCKVSLSNCRLFGPSYRLLPKIEALKPCSGRDELCNSVLNDEWASHPTWASEDSGFVAHRKNGYEEGLHRIEEERHDYDFYIEINQKCIQLLEPIAQQMLALSAADRPNFKLPPGLGGHYQSIYKRVLKKIYGAEKGAEVTNDMFKSPFSVVPIVLARLKQKDEEWRFTQREWEKVWLNQTETMHLKSLDHMGIQVKANDKRNFSMRHLVDIIKTKHEEQRRLRAIKGNKIPRYQFLHSFRDQDLIITLLRFMVLYVTEGGQHNTQERRRIVEFFETFVPVFFDLPEDKVLQSLASLETESAEGDEDDAPPAELANGRPRRNGKKSDLLRAALDPKRNGSRSRSKIEERSGSKETTPDHGSANEEEMPDMPDDAPVPEAGNNRWLPAVPGPIVVDQGKGIRNSDLVNANGELKADAPFPRSWYNFYCNQNIYSFFIVFQTLYQRLEKIKNSTDSVLEEIRRETAVKPAKQLNLIADEEPFYPKNNRDGIWPRTVDLIEDFITGEVEEGRYQEILRRYYLKSGWTLYTITDLLKNLCRLGLSCNNPDSKGEKTKELVKAYIESRQQDETSFQNEISARKFAEKCIKDGEMFVICWQPTKKEATIRWLQKDETTFYMDEMERIQQWQYYISSYMRTEPTEGVSRAGLQNVFLERNLPIDFKGNDDDYARRTRAMDENLIVRICLNSSKIVFQVDTADFFVFRPARGSSADSSGDEPGSAFRTNKQVLRAGLHAEKLREKFVMKNSWMKDLAQEEIHKVNENYARLKQGYSVAATFLSVAVPAAAGARAEAAATSSQ